MKFILAVAINTAVAVGGYLAIFAGTPPTQTASGWQVAAVYAVWMATTAAGFALGGYFGEQARAGRADAINATNENGTEV